MPSSATSNKRVNLRLDPKLVLRVDNFASQNSISRTKAIEEILRIGLDSDLAGVESILSIQSKLSRDLQSMRGLIAASIDASDTSSALSLIHQVGAQIATPDQLSSVFQKARKLAKTQIKQLKKES